MTPELLRVLAVDDERAQLEDLARLLRGSALVADVECACEPSDALTRLAAGRFEAIFLDVRMPSLSGLEVARVLRRFADPPEIVFVSAYDSSAVDAYELHALDYLRKPVSRRRAEEALQRVADAVELRREQGAPAPVEREPAGGEVVAVANPRTGATQLIPRASILYVQAQGDFVRVVAPEGRFLIRATLGEIERRWERHGFTRVHRQYLANLPNASEIRPRLGGTAELVMRDASVVPIARRHLADLQRRLKL